MKRGVQIAKATLSDFSEDKVMRLSAALAYYAVFTLGPLLVIIVGVASLIFDEAVVREQVQAQMEGFLGENGAEAVTGMMKGRGDNESLVATILGAIVLIVGATGFFGQLQDSLNTIWEVQPKPGRGIFGVLRDRFMSFTMILGVAFLLLVSLVVSTALEAATGWIGQSVKVPEAVLKILNLVVAFGVISVLFAMIFKVLPDVKIQWRDVWIGAIGTAALFTIGKYLISLYIGRESTTSAYGAAGSLVVVLLWVYYSSLVLFLGAEFTQVYAKARGARIVPTENAVPVTEERQAQEGKKMTRKPDREGAPIEAAPIHVTRSISREPQVALPVAASTFGVGVVAGVVTGWLVYLKILRR